MSEYMKNDKVITCKLKEEDFIHVGKNDVRNGVGIIVSERDDEASVCLSWEKAKELRDHLTFLLNNEKEFGTYAAHQPNYDSFKASGKLNDYIFQALVHMGNASHQMSWANTVLADQTDVSRELINEIKGINSQIHAFQERLRDIQATEGGKENGSPMLDKLALLNTLEIIESDGDSSSLFYAMVAATAENIEVLKQIGVTAEEIAEMTGKDGEGIDIRGFAWDYTPAKFYNAEHGWTGKA